MAEPVSPQLSPYAVELEEGKTYLWCSCGKSSRQPFCDGSHTDSDFEPTRFKAERTELVYLCGCKKTDDHPFCDGSHNIL
jgi:CDGSH-type Zn-finger protein